MRCTANLVPGFDVGALEEDRNELDNMFHQISPGMSIFRHIAFRRYWTARLLSSLSAQILGLSVGWQVYALTRNPLDLGIVGLALFLPAFALMLAAGALADRLNRVLIMACSLLGEAICALTLLLITVTANQGIAPVLGVMVVLGACRTFIGPAQQALLPALVPERELSDAITLTASTWQIAMVFGPLAGGLLYEIAPEVAYITSIAMLIVATGTSLSVRVPTTVAKEHLSLTMLVAGLRYIWKEKVVFGAMSLDLFAMLIGGVTALLPIYVVDILNVGPLELGALRAAPGIGSIMVAIFLLRRPLSDHAGIALLACVALTGCCIAAFGAAKEAWIAVLALGLMGGFDMVSVFVRETLIQRWTPDGMRGRVHGVNMMFLGASSELSEFRAGVSASIFGAVQTAVAGGLAMVAVSALWWVLFPQLRKTRQLN